MKKEITTITQVSVLTEIIRKMLEESSDKEALHHEFHRHPSRTMLSKGYHVSSGVLKVVVEKLIPPATRPARSAASPSKSAKAGKTKGPSTPAKAVAQPKPEVKPVVVSAPVVKAETQPQAEKSATAPTSKKSKKAGSRKRR
jgi:hypothetical protein